MPCHRVTWLTCGLAVAGCADEPPADPPSIACASYEDTDASPSLSGDVVPIFQLSCNFSSCHSSNATSPAEGLALGPPQGTAPAPATMDDVHAALVSADASRANEKLVVAGAPERSFLLAKLEYEDDAYQACGFDCTTCGDRMPQNSPALAPEQIATIAAWIAAGAPND